MYKKYKGIFETLDREKDTLKQINKGKKVVDFPKLFFWAASDSERKMRVYMNSKD